MTWRRNKRIAFLGGTGTLKENLLPAFVRREAQIPSPARDKPHRENANQPVRYLQEPKRFYKAIQDPKRVRSIATRSGDPISIGLWQKLPARLPKSQRVPHAATAQEHYTQISSYPNKFFNYWQKYLKTSQQ